MVGGLFSGGDSLTSPPKPVYGLQSVKGTRSLCLHPGVSEWVPLPQNAKRPVSVMFCLLALYSYFHSPVSLTW